MKEPHMQTDLLIESSPTILSTPDVFFWFTLLIWILLGLFFVILILFIIRVFFHYQAYLPGKQPPFVILRLSLPKFRRKEEAEKTGGSEQIREMISVAETFFASIGGLKAQKGWRAWFFGRDDHLSFEMVAINKKIYFYMAVPVDLQMHVEQQISSSYPDIHIEQLEDYNIFSPTGIILGSYLVFTRPFVFPIKTYRKLDGDPLNALTNTLSKLEDEEGACIQFIVRSAKKTWRRRGLSIARNMQQGQKLEDAIHGKKTGKKDGWSSIFTGSKKTGDHADRPETYRLSPLEEEAVKGLEEKANKAGMDVNIRLVVSCEKPLRAQQILANLISSFSQYNIYQFGNAFKKRIPRSKKRLIQDFIYRRYSSRYQMVCNTEEVASLWHLPLPSTETPNIHWLLARTAPVPTNIPTASDGGIRLGYNVYRGKHTDIYIKREDRRRHLYAIGKSGSGKTEFLSGLISQDIEHGEGVCVIDPHGDLVEHILGNIPKTRVDDVIVFDPSDLEYPMGLNMLESRDQNLKDFVVQEMIAVFYKLFGAEVIGPLFEHNMRNVMLTLMSDPKHPGTIVEIPRMFSDDAYQKFWVSKVKDPVVRSYWENEMAKTSDFHKSETLGYLISKVGRFVENEMMRNIVGQERSSFDLRDVMDKQKILLVNLSKGKTGEVNSSLLGLIIVSKLQMAALSRADLPEDERKDFYLYIDEFQNYVTDSIATILSEARKYRLCLTLAHQYLGQLVEANGKTQVRDAILGNVGTMLVSRIGPEDADLLEKVYTPTFSGYDLINSDKFTWYTKMVIDNSQAKPFTMKSYPKPVGDRELANAIKQLCRLKYGRDRESVETEILERLQIGVSINPPNTSFSESSW
ncbi:hypothetical protein CO172_01050 [Candidatus Uhrbacteria bacterium CG_4_9_14_3_um_filter_36_7]|uniref:DUF8128 domain-containing protein n=1 Tax=Candidatus Uhrbacteria bacterium CG_4_9_14_3_um_filter_36_7 TaxID=1975033 RepID=A0A2M7XI02_9BACT|nr:MAG: hypothetical protein CO172_01050 [Candidatus Uhrbacteria bacterium CG_4_9_14_3_um_filter_36_7]